MYRIEKKFSFPMGHRLRKHSGKCYSYHGHNFTVLVGVKAEKLDENDMVIDFSDLKKLVGTYFEQFDHCTILNKDDKAIVAELSKFGTDVHMLDSDPTAERISEKFYYDLKEIFEEIYKTIRIDYVTVFENEESKATYSEE